MGRTSDPLTRLAAVPWRDSGGAGTGADGPGVTGGADPHARAWARHASGARPRRATAVLPPSDPAPADRTADGTVDEVTVDEVVDEVDRGARDDRGRVEGLDDGDPRATEAVSGDRVRPLATALTLPLPAVVLAAALALGAGAWWWWQGSSSSPATVVAGTGPDASTAAAPPPGAAGQTGAPGAPPDLSGLVASVPPAPAAAASGAASPTGDATVHVAGAVVRPGVVVVPAGARVVDAVTAAGGPAPDADVDAVNLARPVTDGEMVLVPVPGQEVPAPEQPGGAGPEPGPGGGPGGGGTLVDLNRAGQSQLETLPGIGPVLAGRILQWRQDTGPFASVDDLMAVPGIGPAILDGLRDLATV